MWLTSSELSWWGSAVGPVRLQAPLGAKFPSLFYFFFFEFSCLLNKCHFFGGKIKSF